jgi:hypothetical protein
MLRSSSVVLLSVRVMSGCEWSAALSNNLHPRLHQHVSNVEFFVFLSIRFPGPSVKANALGFQYRRSGYILHPTARMVGQNVAMQSPCFQHRRFLPGGVFKFFDLLWASPGHSVKVNALGFQYRRSGYILHQPPRWSLNPLRCRVRVSNTIGFFLTEYSSLQFRLCSAQSPRR